jgi:6-phosphogluconolactonase (cycloisomerase 2 family)
MIRILLAMAGASAAAAGALGQSVAPALFIGHYHTTTAGVSSFAIDREDGRLTFIERISAGRWTAAVALAPGGRWLAVADAGATAGLDDVRVYEIGPDARLMQVGFGQAPDSIMSMTWISDEVLAIGKTSQTDSRVQTFRFNPQTGQLAHISNRLSGSFTQSLVYIEPYLYSNSPLGATSRIMKWSIGPTGVLTLAGEIDIWAYALNMAAGHSGERLYGAGGISGSGNLIVGLSAGEVMALLPGSPYISPGSSPSQVILTRDDRLLLAAHGSDDTVRSFQVAPDGSLLSLGHTFSLAPTTGSVGNMGTFSAAQGQTLYVTDKWITAAAIHVFRVNPDGSFVQIQAVPESGGGRRPEGGLAVWAPAAAACYANCDGSTAPPVLNVEDFTCFLNEFAAALALPPAQQVAHYANCDHSTAAPVLNVEDFTCFLNRFAAGCE